MVNPAFYTSAVIQQAREWASSLACAPVPAPIALKSTSTPSETLGVWTIASNDRDVLQRDNRFQGEWHQWADLPSIPVRKTSMRAVLLGESVARGFFYDPILTPAKILSQFLSVKEATEVVDLARNDMRVTDIPDLARRAMLLRPDVFVVMAGNNYYDLVAGTDTQCETRQQREEAVAARTRAWVDSVAALGVPVVLVVPDSNLLDWRPELSADSGQVCPRQRESWHTMIDNARTAAASSDWPAVCSAAMCALEIDAGGTASSHYWMGQALAHLGDVENAIDHLEQAREVHYFRADDVPHCASFVRTALVEHCVQHNLGVVDVRTLLLRRRRQVPDRHVFLDYCHLNAPTLLDTLSHVAVEVHKVCGTEVDLDASPSVVQTPEVQAQAHFCAALFNARYGQDAEVVRHHYEEAVRLDSSLRAKFHAYLQGSAYRSPVELSQGMQALRRSDRVVVRRFAQSYRRRPNQERTLRCALKLDEGSVTSIDLMHGSWDLLDDYFSPSALHRDWALYREHPFIFRSREPSVAFHLRFPPSLCEYSLQITLRVPQRSVTSLVCDIALNGQRTASLLATDTWSSHTVAFTPTHGMTRENELQIRWPLTTSTQDCVFGELQRLVLTASPFNCATV